jgi:beta-mannosidase
LLIADQTKVKEQSLRYLAKAQTRLDKYGHSIYRYWPEIWEEQD